MKDNTVDNEALSTFLLKVKELEFEIGKSYELVNGFKVKSDNNVLNDEVKALLMMSFQEYLSKLLRRLNKYFQDKKQPSSFFTELDQLFILLSTLIKIQPLDLTQNFL